MKRKKHSAEQVITKLRKADELLGEGKSPEEVADLVSRVPRFFWVS